MELQIAGKNIEVQPTVRAYVERKLSKLDGRLPRIREVKVEVTEEKTKAPQQRYVVQVTVNSNGTLLRAEERGKDLFKAIDKVKAVLYRQIERYKGKRYERSRGTSLRTEFGQEMEAALSAKVTKVKRFAIATMTVTDAINQMELLGHDFYLFRNLESEEINVVYKRKDGNYGIIEPQ